jgi:hypothetical protein
MNVDGQNWRRKAEQGGPLKVRRGAQVEEIGGTKGFLDVDTLSRIGSGGEEEE